MKYLNYLPELVVLLCISKTLYDPTPVTAALLLIAVLSYMHKMYEENKKKIIEEQIQHLDEKLTEKIRSLNIEVGSMNARHVLKIDGLQTQLDALKESHVMDLAEIDHTLEEFEKTQSKISKNADELQKVISTTNLGNALYTRARRADR